MVHLYLAEVLVQERQHDLERALIRRAHVHEALVARQPHRVRHATLPSRVFIALGTWLIAWGNRLHGAHAPVVQDERRRGVEPATSRHTSGRSV